MTNRFSQCAEASDERDRHSCGDMTKRTELAKPSLELLRLRVSQIVTRSCLYISVTPFIHHFSIKNIALSFLHLLPFLQLFAFNVRSKRYTTAVEGYQEYTHRKI